ncbi:DinB family protein [Planctopirus hydrillae]|uniref:DinB-like domain-containing protein n=1 Tax=Planctopirus hydrillae TaxID=1841610 RepID=A0A1C3E534_9PLAN|nr:DinB family protein [Planctopirus hydrillae]ODA28361.1 hypothetical protein A6X21_11495 [Planctopirus hydrillae]
MFARDLVLYGVNQKYLQSLLSGISTQEAKVQPMPGLNTPFWIAGHLAISTDYARQLLGEELKCPPAWHKAFGPGSIPGNEQNITASLEELFEAVHAGHVAITTLLPSVNEAWAAQPNPVEFLVKNYPSTGDLMAHLLTTHEAIHLGQLSAWRRFRGLPAVSIG